jgi:hypothetical protein
MHLEADSKSCKIIHWTLKTVGHRFLEWCPFLCLWTCELGWASSRQTYSLFHSEEFYNSVVKMKILFILLEWRYSVTEFWVQALVQIEISAGIVVASKFLLFSLLSKNLLGSCFILKSPFSNMFDLHSVHSFLVYLIAL